MEDEANSKEVIEGLAFASNPYKGERLAKNLVFTVDLEKVENLNNAGRAVLKHVAKSLNTFDGSCTLLVQDICIAEHGTYNETAATRIRRGLRNLIEEGAICKSLNKNVYWVNKNVIWR